MTVPKVDYMPVPPAIVPADRSAIWPGLFRAMMPVAALVLLVVITTIIERVNGSDDFLKAGNITRVMRTQAPMGIVAIGMTLVIIAGGIDLSVGSMVAMSAIGGVYLMNSIGSDFLAVAVAVMAMLAVGFLAGVLNGSLVAWGRVAPFIATLGGLAAYRSLARTIFDGTLSFTGGRSLLPLHQHGIPLPFIHDGNRLATLHWPTVIFLVVACVGWVLLNKTRLGRHVFAVGGNERAAAYSAISVKRVKLITYALAGLCCGIAALLNAAANDSVHSGEVGVLYELDAIAAVVVGGTLIAGGSGTVFGTVIGVLILGTINNMMVFLSIPNSLQGVVKGAIIVGAAMVQQIGKRK